MSDRYKNLLFLLVACLLALSATWLHNLWREQQQFTEKLDKSRIDYYLSDFSLMATDELGQQQFLLKGDHFVHNRQSRHSEIYAPSIVVHTDTEALALSAEEAIQKTNQDIELRGDVVISKPETRDTIGFTAKTSDVTYSPVRRIVETERDISIQASNNAEITGTGYHEDLDTRVLEIRDRIHAEYLPQDD